MHLIIYILENVPVGSGYRNNEQQSSYRNQQNYYRGSGNMANNAQRYNNSARHQQTRNQTTHRDPRLKFDNDYDFEKANEKFQEQLTNVEKLLTNATLDGKILFYKLI